jgi:Leucine-rich repeat (LRR) protein
MKIIGAFLLMLFSFHGVSQNVSLSEIEEWHEYTSLEEALANPDSVVRLRLRARLTEIPAQVFTAFPNLVELNLSRNQLKTLPAAISLLKNVKRLIVDRNKLATLPSEIGQMESLQELILNRNELSILPKEIGKLNNLYLIDLWSNNIDDLPKSMKEMKNLKEVDLRVIDMSNERKEELREMLPNVKVHLDKGCDCGN